jgi:predicted CopG family antitoxin
MRLGALRFREVQVLPTRGWLRVQSKVTAPPRAAVAKPAVGMYAACMSTKTISVDLVAYERLRRARRHPGESFSQVIRRARWDTPEHTGAAFLEAMRPLPPVEEEVLDGLEADQRLDRPPEDRWRTH